MPRSITRPLRRRSLGDTLEVLARHDMISPLDRPPLTLLLLATIAMGHPHCRLAQQLALTADVGKRVFFEDEPIFLVLRLTNVGSDTIWVMNFSAISQAVPLSVRRDGEAVPVGCVWIDYI